MKIKELTLEQIFEICEMYDTDVACQKKCPLKNFCKCYLTLVFDYQRLDDEVKIKWKKN